MKLQTKTIVSKTVSIFRATPVNATTYGFRYPLFTITTTNMLLIRADINDIMKYTISNVPLPAGPYYHDINMFQTLNTTDNCYYLTVNVNQTVWGHVKVDDPKERTGVRIHFPLNLIKGDVYVKEFEFRNV